MVKCDFEELAAAQAKAGRRLPTPNEIPIIQREYHDLFNNTHATSAGVVRALSKEYPSINVPEALRSVPQIFNCT